MAVTVVNDLAALDAVELLASFAAGDCTPLQALQGVMERVARRNPEVNAFAAMNPAALSAARESTRRWQVGAARALEGVPLTVSDLVDVAGLPTRRGSKTTDSALVRRDAPLVAVLRAAGAVIIGKTAVSEFGWKYQGDSPLTGITRNPWNSAYSTGGPSAGAVAAAAGFFAPLHVADSGVCVSAAWAGVVGLKLGSLSENQGVAARSVADVALLSAVLKGQAGADAHVDDINGLKLGILRRPGFCAPAGSAAWQAVDDAQKILAGQGATARALILDLPDIEPVFTNLWGTRCALEVAQLALPQHALLDTGLLALATRFGAVQKIDDQHLQSTIAEALEAMAALDVDAIICPSVPYEAPLADSQRQDSTCHPAAWSMLFTLTGQPALTLPMGVDADGLPTAVQIAAAPGRDDVLLRIAHALERGLE